MKEQHLYLCLFWGLEAILQGTHRATGKVFFNGFHNIFALLETHHIAISRQWNLTFEVDIMIHVISGNIFIFFSSLLVQYGQCPQWVPWMVPWHEHIGSYSKERDQNSRLWSFLEIERHFLFKTRKEKWISWVYVDGKSAERVTSLIFSRSSN